ncbi:hypothetical protein, partial [Staphylococcus chromogenes]
TVAVADWIEHALFKLSSTLVILAGALLRNQIDFCNAPRKARLFGIIKYMKLFIHQSNLLKNQNFQVPSIENNRLI